LNEAAAHVEETAHMRRMLGQSELARGRFDSAIHELKRALELDPYDTDAMFGLGVAYRKRGELTDASRVFTDISKRDPDFAGLAEQRGLLLEAQGQHTQAVAAYRAALDKDPSDMALVLRLGAAQVLASKLDEAEQTLAKVIREMPNSAEAEYFIGRIAFARGRTPDALAHFDRALGLDNTKAEYHQYVARSTFDMGNFGRSMEEVEQTLKHDPSVGDAYWVRAMIRLRTGAVRDALKDLDRAIRLNPARIEAHAVRGDCYEQLRQLPEAIRAYKTALEGDPTRGQWWYRTAVLTSDSGARSEAEAPLRRAIELGDKQDPMPYWLPDAHRLAGDIADLGNNRQGAIRAYKRYLEIAQTTAIDYDTVKKKLNKWGVQLEEE
jgi:tetratricopeptide (TPR) repeat protein